MYWFRTTDSKRLESEVQFSPNPSSVIHKFHYIPVLPTHSLSSGFLNKSSVLFLFPPSELNVEHLVFFTSLFLTLYVADMKVRRHAVT
jgi:hypothetical protein